MKRRNSILLCFCLCLSLICSCITSCSSPNSSDDSEKTEINNSVDDASKTLNSTQENSVAMLNYLTMLSQQIESSKNNRLYLETAYKSLVNNTNPDKIDETTQEHILNLLDIIEDYRAIEVKRERLNYLYNQDKAKTIRQAIPNPIAILSTANSLDWKRLAISVVYTVADSYNNYKVANEELDKQYIINGWDLKDKEEENIHKNRKRAFKYMVDVVQENHLPGNLALSEEDIQNFVEAISNDNNDRKLQFLESREVTYAKFGDYWIERANCYYDANDYVRCLECISKYKELDRSLFRKDYAYAGILPKVIVAAQNTYKGNEYIEAVDGFTDDLINNADNSDWALKYFAAQSYMDLYQKTKDKNYLEEVYQIALNNVNQLVTSQEKINNTYLDDVKEVKYTEDSSLSKKENKQIKKEITAYNKALKETRETELPSLYEPLVLNCELLFAVADELKIGSSEQSRIEGILKTDSNGVFISEPINAKYSFGEDNKYEAVLKTNKLGHIELVVPVGLLVDGATITATVETKKGNSEVTDWIIEEVDRSGKTIDTFAAKYTSKSINKIEWNKGANVNISIDYRGIRKPVVLTYAVSKYDENPVIPDEVVFEQK